MAKKKVEEKINLDSILFKCRDILRKARNSGSFFEKRDMMLTNRTTGEVKEMPDVWGELNASDEYQVSLIINRKTSMLVVVDPQMQIYAYRKYELPINLPQVDTKLYLTGWKPDHASGGWRVVNKFYEK